MLRVGLVGLLVVAACAHKSGRVSAPAKLDQAATPVTTSKPELGGSFQCSYEAEGHKSHAPCEISQQGDVLRFELELPALAIEGAVTATDYGFRLVGESRRGEAVAGLEADFMEQGGGGFAGVLRLGNKELATLVMHAGR